MKSVVSESYLKLVGIGIGIGDNNNLLKKVSICLKMGITD